MGEKCSNNFLNCYFYAISEVTKKFQKQSLEIGGAQHLLQNKL